jgi:hypothetical protein
MKILFSALLLIVTMHASIAQQNIGLFSSITATRAIGDKVFFPQHTTYTAPNFL